jgi:hypothetical protein
VTPVTITNTGNVPLTNVSATFMGVLLSSYCPGVPTSLVVNQSYTCNLVNITITQADFDAGPSKLLSAADTGNYWYATPSNTTSTSLPLNAFKLVAITSQVTPSNYNESGEGERQSLAWSLQSLLHGVSVSQEILRH